MNKTDSPIARFVRDATATYMDFYLKYEGCRLCLTDPLTVAAVIAPELLSPRVTLMWMWIFRGSFPGRQDVRRLYESGKETRQHQGRVGCKGREFVGLFIKEWKT
ncbi:MAG: hypothetical protein IPG80_12465 [Anaerolineales bacterium]|uniref:hypothetical protein n=1 Tax=Candidatus Villigracilis vicinus TaxID=3140679 RepID=UPI003136217E|nr:hypothetical protein [Anaerolineales bacterium]